MAIAISVIVDGEERFLNLTPKQKAQFQQQSPVFEFSRIPGTYSFGLEFPLEGNSELLGMAESKFVRDTPLFVESRFYFRGNIQYVGLLLIEEVNKSREKGSIDTSFIVNGWASNISDVSIRTVCDEEIDLGDSQTEIVAAAKTASQAGYPDSKIYFSPFRNLSHYSVEDGYSGTDFNSFDQSSQSFRFNTDSSTSYGLAPSVYMLEVLKRCFEYFGYEATGDVFENPKLQKVLVEGLHSLDDIGVLGSCLLTTSADVEIPTDYTWPDPLFDEVVEDFTVAGVNELSGNFFPIPVTGDYRFDITIAFGDKTGPDNVGLFIPGHYASPIWTYTGSGNETVTYTGVIPLNSSLTNPCGLLLDSGFSTIEVLEGSTISITPVISAFADSNRFLGQFKIGDCLPDITISDFLIAIRKAFGINVFFNDLSKVGFCTLYDQVLGQDFVTIDDFGYEYKKEILEERLLKINWGNSKTDVSDLRIEGSFDTVDDLPIPKPGRIAHAFQTNNWYVAKLNDGETNWEWVVLGPKIDGVQIGSGRSESVVSSAKLPKIDLIEMDSEEVLCRVYDEEGSSSWQEQGQRTWPLYFSIKHGFQPGGVNDYPLSSPYEYDYDGNVVSDFSLLYERENIGAYEVFWKAFVQKLYQSSRITIHSLLKRSAGELLKSKIKIDGVEYIPEKIVPEFTDDSSVKAKLELRKINP
jgi:hypothetical protein